MWGSRSSPHVPTARGRASRYSACGELSRVQACLSTVADSAGARLRKMVTGRMANFDRFLLFSASLECKQKVALGQWPKTAEIDQASEGQGCGQPPHTTLSDSIFKLEMGEETAVNREANLQSHSPPKSLCLKASCRAPSHYACGHRLRVDGTRPKSFSVS